MRAEDRLTGCDHLLIAFDGPVAALPSARPLADRLRVLVAGERIPRRIARTGDPFAVLAYAATIGPGTERAVHAQLCRLEAEMVATARLTPGAGAAFASLAAAGTQLTVVSGLAIEAVRAFLVLHGLDAHVRHLAGRAGPERQPAPELIAAALRRVPGESHLFVGSADDDLAAARAAGVEVLRHHPGDWLPGPGAQPGSGNNAGWSGSSGTPVKR